MARSSTRSLLAHVRRCWQHASNSVNVIENGAGHGVMTAPQMKAHGGVCSVRSSFHLLPFCFPLPGICHVLLMLAGTPASCPARCGLQSAAYACRPQQGKPLLFGCTIQTAQALEDCVHSSAGHGPFCRPLGCLGRVQRSVLEDYECAAELAPRSSRASPPGKCMDHHVQEGHAGMIAAHWMPAWGKSSEGSWGKHMWEAGPQSCDFSLPWRAFWMHICHQHLGGCRCQLPTCAL
jgi:hypothetical protein